MATDVKKLKRYQYERYAVLCKLTYPDVFDHLSYGFSPEGHVQIRNRNHKQTIRVLWHPSKKEVVVVFRGSQTVPDWVLNMLCLPRRKRLVDGTRYYVHLGYDLLLTQPARVLENNLKGSMYDCLIDVLKPLLANGKRVSLIGHSSGGSMAVLAADRLEREFTGKVKRVVTFGQPAAGMRSFKRAYCLSRRTYRICCNLDMVTFLPPIPFMFWHVGRLLWLHNERIYENISTPFRLYKSLTSWLLMPITYHYMHKYIRNKDYFDKR